MKITSLLVDGVLKLRLEGKFTFEAHRDFRDAYKTHLDTKCSTLEIDLGGVDYLDSSALGMLLLAKQSAEEHGKKVRLVNCQGTVGQILTVANFGKLFEIR